MNQKQEQIAVQIQIQGVNVAHTYVRWHAVKFFAIINWSYERQ